MFAAEDFVHTCCSCPDSESRGPIYRNFNTPDPTAKKVQLLLRWARGERFRNLQKDYTLGLGQVRDLGETAACLAKVVGLPEETAKEMSSLSTEVKFGVPRGVVPFSELRVPGLVREKVMRLVVNDKDVKLDTFEKVLDASPESVAGIMSPKLFASLQTAILNSYKESVTRIEHGQILRLRKIGLDPSLIKHIYSSQGADFDRAISELLASSLLGYDCSYVATQRRGDEDVRLNHPDGLIVISAKSSVSGKPISWEEAREVLSCGAGRSPVAYITVGKPAFHKLAVEQSGNMATEQNRHLLFLTVDALVEGYILVAEQNATPEWFLNILRTHKGHMTSKDVRRFVVPSEPTIDC
jgi:hypothetical protein